MAKQRGVHRKAAPKQTRPSRSSPKQSRIAPSVTPSLSPAAPAPPQPPPKRTSYVEAVSQYERGLEALQRHDYRTASDILRSVLDRYPDERELHDRVTLYLRICERYIAPPPRAPQTVEERVYAATLAINAGALDQALEHLLAATTQDPDNDHVHYMLAVALTLKADVEQGLTHLSRSIDLNPDNRALARHDPDLEALRGLDAFRRAMESPSAPGGRQRRRAKSSR